MSEQRPSPGPASLRGAAELRKAETRRRCRWLPGQGAQLVRCSCAALWDAEREDAEREDAEEAALPLRQSSPGGTVKHAKGERTQRYLGQGSEGSALRQALLCGFLDGDSPRKGSAVH